MIDDTVRLRPVREDDLPMLEQFMLDPEAAGTFSWFGWTDPGRMRRRWAENGMLSVDGGQLMVASGTEPLGFVAWRRIVTVPQSSYWNIGIQLLPRAQGRGVGTQAQRLLARYLFAHTPAVRIEAHTDVENIAEQRALEKAGFTREGVLRSVVFRDGRWRDSLSYSVLRDDAP
ncbi:MULTISPECIES: GNAT family N-acetyltransferase [unclassified Streptomyces]|uniref:GNAT family N-acetyltransferase n=1 Tax=unclassified Streptomyces TaxID=2593676 RepID=UPI000D14E5CB|nr:MULTISPECIES: GNAT family protein [unclassified Streptomyces]